MSRRHAQPAGLTGLPRRPGPSCASVALSEADGERCQQVFIVDARGRLRGGPVGARRAHRRALPRRVPAASPLRSSVGGGGDQVGFRCRVSSGCLLGCSFGSFQFRPCLCVAGRARHGEVCGQRSLAYRAGVAGLAAFSRVGGRVGALDGLQRRALFLQFCLLQRRHAWQQARRPPRPWTRALPLLALPAVGQRRPQRSCGRLSRPAAGSGEESRWRRLRRMQRACPLRPVPLIPGLRALRPRLLEAMAAERSSSSACFPLASWPLLVQAG